MFGNAVPKGREENTDHVRERLPAENAAVKSDEHLLPGLSHQDREPKNN